MEILIPNVCSTIALNNVKLFQQQSGHDYCKYDQHVGSESDQV